MIKLGRVSKETRGAFEIPDWVEDPDTCINGNVLRRSDAGCPPG